MDPTPHTPLKKELILRCSPKSYAALSPTSKEKVINLKRKASELSETEIPKDTNEFFVWRLATIKCLLEEAEAAVEGFREALSIGKEKDITELESEIQEKQREIEVLQKEQSILLQEGKLIKEDCQDSPEQVEDAYMNALYTKFLKDSEEGRRYLKKNKTTWSRDTFKTRVAEFLDSRGHQEHEGELFCNILGEWIPKKYVKCAHIVNYSFEGREIDYLFGSENNALKSERNGLYLVAAFEENFDGGNVTIVPDGSLDEQPIEWKAVILNESLLDKTLYGQIKWREVHNKQLTFRNNNRPARRYLYFKHAMAYMHAKIQNFPNFEIKVPRGTMWATPDKQDGYLRRSVLSMIARKIGDEILPKDLITAGTFTDTEPKSGLDLRDELAAYKIGSAVEKIVTGKSNDENEEGNDEGRSSTDDELD